MLKLIGAVCVAAVLLLAGWAYMKFWYTGQTYTNEVVITDPYSSTQRCIIWDPLNKVWMQCHKVQKYQRPDLYMKMKQDI